MPRRSATLLIEASTAMASPPRLQSYCMIALGFSLESPSYSSAKASTVDHMMSTPPLSPPARKASRDFTKSSICSSSTSTPKSLLKTLCLLAAMPPLATMPPA